MEAMFVCRSHVKWSLVLCIELGECWTLLLQIFYSPELKDSTIRHIWDFYYIDRWKSVFLLRVNSLSGFLRVGSHLCSLQFRYIHLDVITIITILFCQEPVLVFSLSAKTDLRKFIPANIKIWSDSELPPGAVIKRMKYCNEPFLVRLLSRRT